MNINMAEGGLGPKSFKDTFSKGSGDAYEVFCGPCTRGGKWIAVEGYCQVCSEYLCDNCLKVHRNLRLTRGHSILDKDQMPLGTVKLFEQPCVEVCKIHHPEIIRFYCNEHDETGCVDCMTFKHKSCKNDRVQDVSDGFQATKEFEKIQENLVKFHKEIIVMRAALDNNLKDLDATYRRIQHQVTSFRKIVNDYLDKVQKQITDEAVKLKEKHQTEIKALIAENESKKSELEDTLQRIQNDSSVNVNSLFVLTKQAKLRLDTMKRDSDYMKKQQKQRRYKFLPSMDIENLISDHTPLGKLCKEININTTATYRGNIKVKSYTDRNDCSIIDSTLLGPDKMVVIDTENSRVKLIHLRHNTVISNYQTSGLLCGITAISSKQVAVTVPTEVKIQILDVTTTITTHHVIQVKQKYTGIAYKDGKFAASILCSSEIHILDNNGTILHMIQPKHGNSNVFLAPQFIAFSKEENDTIVLSDHSDNEVCMITFRGQILRTYKHDELKGPLGIALTSNGVLLVCSKRNGCVHGVLPDFTTSKIIIKDCKNKRNPVSIMYCERNNRLYANNENSIQVYDLNE